MKSVMKTIRRYVKIFGNVSVVDSCIIRNIIVRSCKRKKMSISNQESY